MGVQHYELSKEQLTALLADFSTDEHKKRIYELNEHNVGELAEYVAELVRTCPPGETRERFLIYGLTKFGADHYQKWAKRILIQRIMTWERDDNLRRRNKPVPSLKPSQEQQESAIKVTKTVRRIGDGEIASEPQQVRPVRSVRPAPTVAPEPAPAVEPAPVAAEGSSK